MQRLFLATRNTQKTREFAQILGNDFTVSDLSSTANVPEIEEIGRTFEENAILKALARLATPVRLRRTRCSGRFRFGG
jgi:XTP/dITP diphosphohydrolase